MATLTVSMPDPMRGWIDREIESGRYANADAYVRDLIHRDQERSLKIAQMQKLVDEGLESGVSDESMDDILRSMQDAAE